jgi:hypothetical protein
VNATVAQPLTSCTSAALAMIASCGASIGMSVSLSAQPRRVNTAPAKASRLNRWNEDKPTVRRGVVTGRARRCIG